MRGPKLTSEIRNRVCDAYHHYQQFGNGLDKIQICLLLSNDFTLPTETVRYIHEKFCPIVHRQRHPASTKQ